MGEMFLLGAGASMDAGVPGAFAMTRSILDSIYRKQGFAKSAHTISYVVGGLLFGMGKNNMNPLDNGINIEDLFNAIRLLADRNSIEAAPFIGSWHSFVEELDRISPDASTISIQREIHKSVVQEISNSLQRISTFNMSYEVDRSFEASLKQTINNFASNPKNFSVRGNFGKAVEKVVSEMLKKIQEAIRSSSSFSTSVDKKIQGTISSMREKSGNGQVFSTANDVMLAALKDLVWIEDSNKVNYLLPILNVLKRQNSITIATLNYDNSIELTCSTSSTSCNNCLGDWMKGHDIRLKPTGINLLKLHGSIDWTRDLEAAMDGMPETKIRLASPKEIKSSIYKPVIIFGSRNKLTADGPFLDLLHKFKDELSKHDVLTIVGYSFSDHHINVYISKWLNSSSQNVLRIINGENFNLTSSASGDMEFLGSLYRYQTAHPQRIIIINLYAKDGLRKIFGPYNEDLRPTTTRSPSALELVGQAEAVEGGQG